MASHSSLLFWERVAKEARERGEEPPVPEWEQLRDENNPKRAAQRRNGKPAAEGDES